MRFSIIYCTLFFIIFTQEPAFSYEPQQGKPDITLSKADQKKLKKEIARHIKDGNRYYDSHKYNLAIYEWQLALSLDPSNKNLKRQIDNAAARLGKITDTNIHIINVTTPFREAREILPLKKCIDVAIKNNLPLKVAERQAKLAELKVIEAARNMLPKITWRVEETLGKVNARYYTGRKDLLEGQHTLFDGGETYFILKQAQVNLKVVKEDYNRIKNDLILQVKKGYYSLGKAKENLALQRELSGDVDRIGEMVEKEFEAGVCSRIELLNVRAQHSQVQFQLLSAIQDVDTAELILQQAMTIDPEEHIDVEPNLKFKTLDTDLDICMRIAFQNRPEIKINNLMVEYYLFEKRALGAKKMPRVELMGSWGLTKEEYLSADNGPQGAGPNFTVDPDQDFKPQWYGGFKTIMPFWGSSAEYSFTREKWNPVVSAYQGTEAITNAVKVGILDNLKLYTAAEEAEAGYGRAQQEREKVVQDVTLEVREGFYGIRKTALQFATSENKVRHQTQDLEYNKFRRGLDEVPDSALIESMIKFAQEKFGYAQAITDYYIAVASINKAMGVPDYFKLEE